MNDATHPPIFFASDLHLGAPSAALSRERERLFVRWLEEVASLGREIHLVGDSLDFWFEWKHVVPRGHVRLFGAIAALVDSGTPVHWHLGNHDLWSFGYLEQELGVTLHREPVELELFGERWLVGHGDGLGPHDRRYKRLKRVFTNRLAQWSFARLHPNLACALAQRWSRSSRIHNAAQDGSFNGIENEWLFQYVQDQFSTGAHDGYIFGHRHLPLDVKLHADGSHTLIHPPSDSHTSPKAPTAAVQSTRYINTGEWLHRPSYVRFGPEGPALLQYS